MGRRSRTEFAILGMLAQCPLSGYDLKQLFEERIAHFWAESAGQIYPTLKKLADARMVNGKDKSRGSGPKRIEYRITEKGRRYLEQWLHEPVQKEQVRNELLLKIYFGPSADVKVLLKQIDAFEAMQKFMKTRFEQSATEIEEQEASDLQKDYWRLTLMSGQLVNDARIRWCRQARKTLSRYVQNKDSHS